MPLIRQKLSQPGTPATEILRLLQLEQEANLARQQAAADDPELYSAFALNNDGLAELQKVLLKIQSAERNTLNLDGPKMSYLRRAFCGVSREALISMGTPPKKADEITQAMDEAWEKELPKLREKLKEMDETGENLSRSRALNSTRADSSGVLDVSGLRPDGEIRR
jgi:hypothetical protein